MCWKLLSSEQMEVVWLHMNSVYYRLHVEQVDDIVWIYVVSSSLLLLSSCDNWLA